MCEHSMPIGFFSIQTGFEVTGNIILYVSVDFLVRFICQSGNCSNVATSENLPFSRIFDERLKYIVHIFVFFKLFRLLILHGKRNGMPFGQFPHKQLTVGQRRYLLFWPHCVSFGA